MGSLTPDVVEKNGPQSVEATLNFYPKRPDREQVYNATPSYYKRELDPHRVSVENVRGREGDFTFDKHGIEWFTAPTVMKYEDYNNPEKVETTYVEEAMRILKER